MNKKLSALVIFAFLLGLFAENASAQASGVKPELIMYRHNGGGITPNPVIATNILGTLKWNGLTATGNIVTGASIRSVARQVAPGLLRADMTFSTSTFDRMIITENGLVGIGTMTPLYHLDVLGNTHTAGRFYGRIHFDNDTQNSDEQPNTYIDEAYFQRKARTDIGLSANTYVNGGILSLAPGGGSLDRQIFTGGNDGIWTRSQDLGGAQTWAAWEKLLTSGDIHGNVGSLPRFTGANLGDPSSTLGNSQLFDDGTRVGIGTTSPSGPFLLTVAGNTSLGGNTTVNGLTTTNSLNVNVDANVDGSLQVDGNGRVDGRLFVGSPNPAHPGAMVHQLYVGGSAIAEEVVVKLKANWPDYVFAQNHAVQPLSEVAAYIQTENHLPGIPSAAEVAENGISLGAMQKAQMEKIEELYLHMIAMDKEMKAVKAENATLKAKLEQLEQRN